RSTLADIDSLLKDTDELLAARYPGERDVRQPVHTVYVPGHVSTPDLPRKWGQQALDFVDAHGGMLQLAERVITAARKEAGPQAGGQIPSLHQVAREAELLAEAVTSKLRREPIEDLRRDFEDRFGDQGDDFEDQWGAQAARDAVAGQNETGAPACYGIRFKCLETPTRARACAPSTASSPRWSPPTDPCRTTSCSPCPRSAPSTRSGPWCWPAATSRPSTAWPRER